MQLTQILTLKMNKFIKLVLFLLVVTTSQLKAQNAEVFEQIGYLLNDALLYSNKYITPATDAAVYQASSGWMTSAKKKELGEVTFGVNANLFFVPKLDRTFTASNNDFEFFSIEGQNSIEVPTALGNNEQYYLVGDLGGSEVRLKSPEGVNEETVFYPYLQAGVGLWYGTEVLVKYSPKTKLKKGDYQVYGAALKHNLDQYFSENFNKTIHVSALVAYSKENLSFDFVDIQSAYGTLGINSLGSSIDTYQTQINISKTHKNLEVLWGVIFNVSDFNYKFDGEKGSIEEIVPLQDILNDRMRGLSKTKRNLIGEFSGRYQFSKFFVQGTLAFGKFVNTNISLQYEF
jgi:hypothetical protein